MLLDECDTSDGETQRVEENVFRREDDSLLKTDAKYYTHARYQKESKKRNDPLYPGAKMSKWELAVLLTYMMVHHKFTYNSVANLIILLKAILPAGAKIIKSVTALRKIVTKAYTVGTKKYCQTKLCNKFIESKNCVDCNSSDNIVEFLVLPIDQQLKVILARKKIRNLILKRSKKTVPGFINSMADGTIYKAHSKFLSENNHFSFCYYSDGVKIFDCNTSSFWPFFLVINELPQKERYKIENMILLGLWYNGKPNFNIFLQPSVEQFDTLKKDGFDVDFNENGKKKSLNFKCMLLCGHGDSPCKSQMLNVRQFNGHKSCLICLQDPKQPFDEKGKAITKNLVYDYQTGNKLRTSKMTKICGEEADRTGIPQNGVKGSTVLSTLLPNFHIESMGCDNMHILFSGVFKKLIELWFDKKHKNEIFSLYDRLKTVDAYLKNIKKPGFISKAPRSIEVCFSFFATIEFKNIFYYYSLPILSKIKMDPKRFEHYFLLVRAIFLLNQESISDEDLIRARINLKLFVKNFQIYYGVQYMSSNIHGLLHLGLCVKRLGNLYNYDCFPKENLNGQMKRFVKGPNSAHLKIAHFHFTALNIPLYIENLPKTSIVLNVIEKIKYRGRPKKLKPINEKCVILGINYVVVEQIMSSLFSDTLKKYQFPEPKNLKFFSRLSIRGTVYAAKIYNRASRTVSYCVEYLVHDEDEVGLIECFCDMCDCKYKTNCKCKSQCVALMRVCERKVIDGLKENKFVSKLRITDSYVIVDVNNIITMCAMIDLKGDIFCARRVNEEELE